MHIEPGIVSGAKIILSYATAALSGAIAVKMAWEAVKKDGAAVSLLGRTLLTTALVFCFFEVLPHHPVGVSEVHLILGSTLFLIFGAAPTALGLAFGLALQGVLFAPFDLPQYGMNLTTLLVPLYAMSLLAKKMIPAGIAYKDVTYVQALALSTSYQAGIVVWVTFWACYGEGVNLETLANVSTFGLAYMSVILIEPLIDLGVLALAKLFSGLEKSGLVQNRLYKTA